jgi:hypothetical protein
MLPCGKRPVQIAVVAEYFFAPDTWQGGLQTLAQR